MAARGRAAPAAVAVPHPNFLGTPPADASLQPLPQNIDFSDVEESVSDSVSSGEASELRQRHWFWTENALGALIANSCFRFDDAGLEERFLEFLFPPALNMITVAGLAVMGFGFCILNPLNRGGFAYDQIAETIIGGFAWVFGIVLFVSQKFKLFWLEPRHSEYAWFLGMNLWSVGLMILHTRGIISFSLWSYSNHCDIADQADLYPHRYEIDDCGNHVIEGYSWLTLIGLLTGVARMIWVPYVLLMNLAAYLGIRWMLVRHVSILRSNYVHVFFYWMNLVCVMAREYRFRRQFTQRLELREKMKFNETAKHAIHVIMINILPSSILSRLMKQQTVIDCVEEASVLFSEMTGFTEWSMTASPLRSGGNAAVDIVKVLNGLYRRVDRDLEGYGVDKVTTIGDAYWAACGVLRPFKDHALRLTAFGLEMQRHVASMRLTPRTMFETFNMRIGIATGELIGGITGSRQMAYQVIGPVNEAAQQLAQLAPPGGVLVSSATFQIIQAAFVTNPFSSRDLRTTVYGQSYIIHQMPWQSDDQLSISRSTNDDAGSSQHRSNTSRASSKRRFRANHQRRILLLSGIYGTPRESSDPIAPPGELQNRSAEASAEMDLVAERERIGQLKRTCLPSALFFSFEDRETELAYGEYVLVAFKSLSVVGIASLVGGAWCMIAIIILMAESFETGTPHHPGLFAVYAALAVFNLLNGIFASKIRAALSWLRFSIDFMIQLVALFIFVKRANRHSLLAVDPFFIASIYCLIYSHFGLPKYHWSIGLFWCWGTIIVPVIVWYALTASLGVSRPVNLTLTHTFNYLITAYRAERESREQYLDHRVAVIADVEIQRQRHEMKELLSRMIPPFAIDSVTKQLTDRRKMVRCIAHSVEHAAVLFIRVPAAAEKMSHTQSTAADAFAEADRMSTLYDDALMMISDVNAQTFTDCGILKVRTIGDVALFASGLHRGVESVGEIVTAEVGESEPDVQFTLDDDGRAIAGVRIPGYAVQDVLELTLLATKLETRIREMLGHPCAAGIHSGSVVSGVIGMDRLVYDVFGETVSYAARIMSTTRDDRMEGVWLSAASFALLKKASFGGTTLKDPSTAPKRSMRGKGGSECFRIAATPTNRASQE